MTRLERRRTAVLAASLALPLILVGLAAALRSHAQGGPAVPSVDSRFRAEGYEVMARGWGAAAVPGKMETLGVLTPADGRGDRYSVWAHRPPGEQAITLRGRRATGTDEVCPKFEAVYPADGGPPQVASGQDLAGERVACDRVAAILHGAKMRT